MAVSEFLLTTFLGLGVDIAKKGVVFLYSTREGKRILRKSIKKTSQRFKGYAPGGEKAVKQYLEIWVQTTEFKKSLIALEKGNSIEESLQDAFQEFNRISISNLHAHSNKVLVFLFEQLKEEIINSSKGLNLLLNFVLRKIDDLSEKSDSHHEETSALILESRDSILESLKRGQESFSESQKDAVNDYFSASQNWDSHTDLIKKGAFEHANLEIQKRLNKLEELYSSYLDSEKIFNEHHIELLLKQASASANLGDYKEAENLYSKAKYKGIESPYLKRLESKVLLNLNKIEDFEVLVNENELSEMNEAKAELLMLKGDWEKLLELIPVETDNFRLLYLSIIAQLQGYDNQKLSQKASEIYSKIHKASSLTGEQPIHKIQIANISITLLRKISFGMLETEGIDRSEFVKKIRIYINEAIQTCREVLYEKGLTNIFDSALNFYSFLEEEEAIKATQLEIQQLNSIEEASYEHDLRRGAISQALDLHNKAAQMLKSSGLSEKETIEHLFKASFDLSTKDEKQIVGRSLINFYLLAGEPENAKAILSRLSNLDKHERKLIEFLIEEKETSTEELLIRVKELVEQFPLSIQFRRYYSDLIVERIRKNAENDNNDLIELIKGNSDLLNELLPTDSNLIAFAQALIANNDFNGAIKVLKEVSTDTMVHNTALRLIAHCLIKSDRTNEVPNILIELANITNDPNYANEAVRYYINNNQAEPAYRLLTQWVERFPDNPELLANYGLSIVSKEQVSPDQAELALGYLKKANDLKPDLPNIFLIMSRAARIAGKNDEYHEYFTKHWSELPVMKVKNKDDFYDLNDKMKGGAIRVDMAGKDGIKAFIEWDNEFKTALNTFHKNDLMTYVDTLSRNGQPWRQWIGWTSKADKYYYKSSFSLAIKSPWPFTRELEKKSKGILLDITALLSLCVLSQTDRILREVKDQGTGIFLRSNELRSLRRALNKPEEVFFEVIKSPFDEIYQVLEHRGLIIDYSNEDWINYSELVPNELHANFGNHTPDLGMSISLGNSLFILDKVDGMEDENVNVIQRLTSSKELLKSLVGKGLIGENEADLAGSKNERFDGWRDASELSLPDNIVFSAFSIQHWFESGLLTLQNDAWINGEDHWPKIHLGPFAIGHLIVEADLVENEKKVSSLASTQLSELEGLITEEIVEVLPDTDKLVVEDSSFFSSSNVNAINLLELAKAKDLNLWTDDRIFGYLLWPFNHPLPFQELRNEFAQLQKKYSSINYYTTEDILERIQWKSENKEFAETQGYRLVELGYRPLNFRLAINYLLNNYSYNPQLPKYKSFVHALEGLLIDDNYDPDSKVDKKPQQRLFLARVIPGVIANILLSNTRTSFDERKKFASDILSVMIKYVDRHRNEMKDKMSSFWVSLLHEIVDYKIFNRVSINNENDFQKSLDGAIDWFAESISKFEKGENINRAIIAIEDFLVKTVTQLKVMSENIDDAQKFGVSEEEIDTNIKSLISRRILLLIRPLLHQDLIDKFNPLLRRCLGHISSFPHEFKLDEVYWFDDGIKKAKDQIPEDELELFVIGIFEDILNGSPEYGKFLTGDLRVFCTWNRLKPKAFRAPNDNTYGVPINISMIRLILRDELHELPKIIETIVSQLQLIDPILGADIQRNSNNLVSKNTETRKKAREVIALSIISSVYFELQRSLLHAFSKLQELETEELDKFLAPDTGWAQIPNHPQIFDFNNKEYPRGFQVELSFLTLSNQELYQICAQTVESFQSDIDKSDEEIDVVAFYTSILEEEISSFKLGYRFLEFLITISKGREKIDYKGNEIKVDDYLKEILTQILSEKIDQNEAQVLGAYRSRELRVIYCSILRLATFVNGSAKHVSSWENELDDTDQVMLNIIHSNLIFTNRLLPFLNSKYNSNYSELEIDLVEVLKKLSIHYDNPVKYPDQFNPLILGHHLLDQEVASVIHSLTVFIMHNDSSESVLDLNWLLDLVEPWIKSANQEAEEIYTKQKQESTNVIGIKVPLSPKEAAEKLIEAIKKRLDGN